MRFLNYSLFEARRGSTEWPIIDVLLRAFPIFHLLARETSLRCLQTACPKFCNIDCFIGKEVICVTVPEKKMKDLIT
uniref:Uncharacterized protein n=1 Tax=Anguilla anguilla TaxID=7936 RepID=A0A0E9WU16_ANGAN